MVEHPSGTQISVHSYFERQCTAGPARRARQLHPRARMGNLLWLIIVVLLVLWLVGFFAVNIGGNLIHILLVIALILVIYRLATGRKVL